tara:strand:- start:1361 stop:2128 length:768 start_codon:yes stop_codon:yes gene_type:complete
MRDGILNPLDTIVNELSEKVQQLESSSDHFLLKVHNLLVSEAKAISDLTASLKLRAGLENNAQLEGELRKRIEKLEKDLKEAKEKEKNATMKVDASQAAFLNVNADIRASEVAKARETHAAHVADMEKAMEKANQSVIDALALQSQGKEEIKVLKQELATLSAEKATVDEALEKERRGLWSDSTALQQWKEDQKEMEKQLNQKIKTMETIKTQVIGILNKIEKFQIPPPPPLEEEAEETETETETETEEATVEMV